MLLATKAFGKIDIDSQKIIRFPDGLYGFSDQHEFIFIDKNEDSPFIWMQSTNDPELAFILLSPDIFLKNPYFPEPSESELESLQVDSPVKCLIYVIVTIPNNHPEKMTANLQGPILINEQKRIGRQVISNNDKHTVRVSILEYLDE